MSRKITLSLLALLLSTAAAAMPGTAGAAAAFWSLTLYDTDTRSMIQNPSNDSARSGYDKLKTNADGSMDLYFGPKAPAGHESNWIETVPGKGFYPMFRFYKKGRKPKFKLRHCPKRNVATIRGHRFVRAQLTRHARASTSSSPVG